MSRKNSHTFVSEIGIKRIFLEGDEPSQYSILPNAETIDRKINIGLNEKLVRTVIIEFANELDMYDFLQSLIDAGVPFLDDYKSNAYGCAVELLQKGKVKGHIQGC